MGEIYEIIPISAGVILAFVFARFRPSSQRLRWAVTAAVAVVIGFIAATVSGEIHESWAFVILDTVQVVLAMALVTWLLDRRAHRPASAKRKVE